MNKKNLISVLLITASIFCKVDQAQKMVNLRTFIPNVRIDCMYATDRNFTGKVIYKEPKCYLLKEVAEQLKKVQAELNKKGLGILVWDAYRPMEAQKRLWEVFPDPRYVAPPDKGGKHTRGTSIDLTIIQLSNGKQLEMPTEFDNFTKKAWLDSDDCSDEAKKNRTMLITAMKKYGFEPIKTEWWHFDYKGWRDLPPLQITFDQLS